MSFVVEVHANISTQNASYLPPHNEVIPKNVTIDIVTFFGNTNRALNMEILPHGV